MPRRLILSATERDTLLALPESQDDLIRYYTFNDSDLSLIRQRRGDANRLGFAVQLQHPGEGDLVLAAGGFSPGGNVQDIEGSQTLHLQPAGGNGFAHRNWGEGALEDPADIGAVIRQQGIAFHRLLHGFLQDGFKARDGLPAQFKLHFHSPLR